MVEEEEAPIAEIHMETVFTMQVDITVLDNRDLPLVPIREVLAVQLNLA
jgi:hypothetical protein